MCTRKRSGLGGVVVLLFALSCATTNVTSTWKDPLYQGPLHRVMVVGIFDDSLSRRLCEDEFVKHLKDRGTDAVASYTVLPDQNKLPGALIEQKIRQVGADSVLIAELVARTPVIYHMPGSFGYHAYYRNRVDYFYDSGGKSAYPYGSVEPKDNAVMQTNVYDASTSKLIWAGSTETDIVGSDKNFIKSYVGEITKKLSEAGMLAKP